MTRLETIVRNFLEFARPPALKRQPESVSLLLGKTLQLVRPPIEAKRISLVCDNPDGLPPIMADRQQIEQVFINLLNNAAEATSAGGEIRVSVAASAVGDAGGMVAVRIRDTGSGMPPDVQSRVFEPFFTTKESGTGLGLCIAAGIMARHEGRLVLESSSERGTTFAVHIPVARVESHE
jgi:signal transduction histidine kinase